MSESMEYLCLSQGRLAAQLQLCAPVPCAKDIYLAWLCTHQQCLCEVLRSAAAAAVGAVRYGAHTFARNVLVQALHELHWQLGPVCHRVEVVLNVIAIVECGAVVASRDAVVGHAVGAPGVLWVDEHVLAPAAEPPSQVITLPLILSRTKAVLPSPDEGRMWSLHLRFATTGFG